MKSQFIFIIFLGITLCADTFELNASPRTMAEWEQLDGLLIAWDREEDSRDIQVPLIEYASQETMVYIVCNDSDQVKNYLNPARVRMQNLKMLYEDYDSIWCRDYGPWSIYKNAVDSLSFVDWIYQFVYDDRLPAKLAGLFSIPHFECGIEPNKILERVLGVPTKSSASRCRLLPMAPMWKKMGNFSLIQIQSLSTKL